MDPMLMTCPLPRSTIPGTTRRVMAKRAFTFVSITTSHSSRLPSCSLSTPMTKPALFTNTSMAFHSSGRESKAARTAARSRTSNGNSHTSTPYFSSNSSFTAFSFSTLRPFRISRCPFMANLRAHPSPIPEEAPVINTVFFSISHRF